MREERRASQTASLVDLMADPLPAEPAEATEADAATVETPAVEPMEPEPPAAPASAQVSDVGDDDPEESSVEQRAGSKDADAQNEADASRPSTARAPMGASCTCLGATKRRRR